MREFYEGRRGISPPPERRGGVFTANDPHFGMKQKGSEENIYEPPSRVLGRETEGRSRWFSSAGSTYSTYPHRQLFERGEHPYHEHDVLEESEQILTHPVLIDQKNTHIPPFPTHLHKSTTKYKKHEGRVHRQGQHAHQQPLANSYNNKLEGRNEEFWTSQTLICFERRLKLYLVGRAFGIILPLLAFILIAIIYIGRLLFGGVHFHFIWTASFQWLFLGIAFQTIIKISLFTETKDAISRTQELRNSTLKLGIQYLLFIYDLIIYNFLLQNMQRVLQTSIIIQGRDPFLNTICILFGLYDYYCFIIKQGYVINTTRKCYKKSLIKYTKSIWPKLILKAALSALLLILLCLSLCFALNSFKPVLYKYKFLSLGRLGSISISYEEAALLLGILTFILTLLIFLNRLTIKIAQKICINNIGLKDGNDAYDEVIEALNSQFSKVQFYALQAIRHQIKIGDPFIFKDLIHMEKITDYCTKRFIYFQECNTNLNLSRKGNSLSSYRSVQEEFWEVYYPYFYGLIISGSKPKNIISKMHAQIPILELIIFVMGGMLKYKYVEEFSKTQPYTNFVNANLGKFIEIMVNMRDQLGELRSCMYDLGHKKPWGGSKLSKYFNSVEKRLAKNIEKLVNHSEIKDKIKNKSISLPMNIRDEIQKYFAED